MAEALLVAGADRGSLTTALRSLQQSVGNRAVQRLVASAGAGPRQSTVVVQRVTNYWTDEGASADDNQPQGTVAGTVYWKAEGLGGTNNLYKNKSGAYSEALSGLGIRDKRAEVDKWKYNAGKGDIQMLFPDRTHNETRALVNHTSDKSKTLTKMKAFRDREQQLSSVNPADHYHLGLYTGLQLPGAKPTGWTHVGMPHFFALPSRETFD